MREISSGHPRRTLGTPKTDASAARDRSSEDERPGDAAEMPLPLSGLRVVDVGTFLAGPYAASIMGEFGAEVFRPAGNR
jgi:succinyl-CoA:(S)-malate CoA-transferase subunit A